jgi:hypothetical protein
VKMIIIIIWCEGSRHGEHKLRLCWDDVKRGEQRTQVTRGLTGATEV